MNRHLLQAYLIIKEELDKAAESLEALMDKKELTKAEIVEILEGVGKGLRNASDKLSSYTIQNLL